jgi:Protein of unknown function (DUF3618)
MDDSTGRVGAIDPALPAETDKRAREIRKEIAETRGEMSETIEAIQERLTPSSIVANAKETVRNVATEKVKQMANTAGDAADRVMNNTFMDTVRANPVPAAMIGIGAAWLLLKGRSESPRYDRTGRYLLADDDRTTEYGDQYGWRSRTGSSTSRYGAGDTTPGGISGLASDAASRASDAAAEVRYAAQRTTRRAQLSFDRVLRENPLALGAAATLVGAAIGMTMPATETENQLMGDARDSVVERARGIASEAAEKVQNAAEQVKDVASRTVESTIPNTPARRPGGTV